MEDSRAACHDRCFFCVVVFGFGPFFRYVAPTVLRVSITDPARIAISHTLLGRTFIPNQKANSTEFNSLSLFQLFLVMNKISPYQIYVYVSSWGQNSDSQGQNIRIEEHENMSDKINCTITTQEQEMRISEY